MHIGAQTPGRAPQREAMSKVDTAWLRMERPTNLMMITGVLMFSERLELDAFKQLIRERFLAFNPRAVSGVQEVSPEGRGHGDGRALGNRSRFRYRLWC